MGNMRKLMNIVESSFNTAYITFDEVQAAARGKDATLERKNSVVWFIVRHADDVSIGVWYNDVTSDSDHGFIRWFNDDEIGRI